MPGWLIIVIGIVLGLLPLLFDGLFIVGMFAFGIITSFDWAEALFASAGISKADIYMVLAVGFVITGLISSATGSGSFTASGLFGGALIMVLFTLFGLLAYPGPAAFIATTVMPALNNIVVRIAAVFSLPMLILVIFMLSITGVV